MLTGLTLGVLAPHSTRVIILGQESPDVIATNAPANRPMNAKTKTAVTAIPFLDGIFDTQLKTYSG